MSCTCARYEFLIFVSRRKGILQCEIKTIAVGLMLFNMFARGEGQVLSSLFVKSRRLIKF